MEGRVLRCCLRSYRSPRATQVSGAPAGGLRVPGKKRERRSEASGGSLQDRVQLQLEAAAQPLAADLSAIFRVPDLFGGGSALSPRAARRPHTADPRRLLDASLLLIGGALNAPPAPPPPVYSLPPSRACLLGRHLRSFEDEIYVPHPVCDMCTQRALPRDHACDQDGLELGMLCVGLKLAWQLRGGSRCGRTGVEAVLSDLGNKENT
ncbi:hypothetical protein NDU88_003735 [Pleurodeles waltl]|uniref:Uncharacterized protein n=1 Tax=Pleurodeles waltl TaxID=8319 RepID=A0AAV7WW55_PLEWA|nr:hypothetical protein NDU88_003735 [Pleurodeles waltl]